MTDEQAERVVGLLEKQNQLLSELLNSSQWQTKMLHDSHQPPFLEPDTQRLLRGGAIRTMDSMARDAIKQIPGKIAEVSVPTDGMKPGGSVGFEVDLGM